MTKQQKIEGKRAMEKLVNEVMSLVPINERATKLVAYQVGLNDPFGNILLGSLRDRWRRLPKVLNITHDADCSLSGTTRVRCFGDRLYGPDERAALEGGTSDFGGAARRAAIFDRTRLGDRRRERAPDGGDDGGRVLVLRRDCTGVRGDGLSRVSGERERDLHPRLLCGSAGIAVMEGQP